MKSIEYYCGKEFDPTCGKTLTADVWLLSKIEAAKRTKYLVNVTTPFDSIRSNRITSAIEDWTKQYNEIYDNSSV